MRGCPLCSSICRIAKVTAPRSTIRRGTVTSPVTGFASVRVDIRGSGDSDGVLSDEYSAIELSDAVEVIDWLAAQPWCNGRVGMIGISWGGFNALQVAALAPPALCAVISVCSTDDRYADDVHYVGGAVLARDMLGWAMTLLALNAQPPDPVTVGARWRELWQQRLDATPAFIDTWLSHPTRDDYWRHGSVCENYAAIRCPVLDRRRLGRRLHQRGVAVARRTGRAVPRHHRSVGASVPARGSTRPEHRFLAGGGALVGSVAQWNRSRRAARTEAARLVAALHRATTADVARRVAGQRPRGRRVRIARVLPRRRCAAERGRRDVDR